MSLPNELLNSIFEYVYFSLCTHRAHSEPDFPTGAKLVFSRFSLVSKTWHSLSLPFLVRHFDGKNVEAFTAFVKKNRLFKSVKSMYINPEFKGWQNPGKWETSIRENYFFENCEEHEMYRDCGEAADEQHREDLHKEKKKWSVLLEKTFSTLSLLEIGSRRRCKLEQGPWYGEWHQGASEEDYEFGNFDTAPALDLIYFIKSSPVAQQVRSLRLNLPQEADTVDDEGYAVDGIDDQLAGLITSHFPNLENYILHSHSRIPLGERSNGVSFRRLRSLQIYNVYSDSLGLRKNLRPTYLVPSAASLRRLVLQVGAVADAPALAVAELFGPLQFPLLEELHLDIPNLSCTQSDFFDRFPRIKTASIPLDPALTHTNTLPLLPPSLTTLTLIGLDDSSLTPLANHLRREDLSQLTRLVLQSTSDVYLAQPESALPRFETSETPTVDLATIIRICTRNQVEVCYSTATPGEDFEIDQELSEDENWDWDAEDGEEYRSLWSEEKKRSFDIDEAFSKIRYWMKSDEAEEIAKNAIKPSLRNLGSR